MRTGSVPYQKFSGSGSIYEKGKGLQFINNIGKSDCLFIAVSFLLGRASIVGGLLPFGMAFYASTAGMNINRYVITAFILLGMVTRNAADQLYLTIAAMLLFKVFTIPLRIEKTGHNLKLGIVAFISTLIPEFVIAYMQGLLLYDVLMALFHGVIVFSLIFIYRNAMGAILEIRDKSVLTNEEVISVAILTALVLSGLSGIEVMGFALKNVLSILVILLCSYKFGSGVGAATGVTIGLIISINSPAAPVIVGSYAICGLLSGVLKNLGKVGSSLGFIMGNAVFTLYINGSTEVIIYFKEIILAVIIFMLIPQKVMDSVLDIFGVGTGLNPGKKGYTSRIKELTVDKLNRFSESFKELSKTFSEISETSMVADKQELSVLFDRVADRVCRDCSLCLHCWDRNFYNTYQVMFKIVERLDSKGRIENKDIPDYFISRCERINDFVIAVNNVYELFKVDMVWKGKISESRELVSQQLEGLSKVVSNLACEIDTDVKFKVDMEENLLLNLNRAGIKTNEVLVFENKWGKLEVSISHKGCGGKRACISSIEKIVSLVVGKKMVKDSVECVKKVKDNTCTLRLVEEETFSVTTGIAKLSKYESMVSGDSYTFMNTGNGKFIVAISDGMGTGHKAAVQSRATINMLEQFMESGFDKDTAVKLINSILVLKSDEDSFATIDLSVIDLYEGEVEFVKIGAVSTFIKREQKVDTVKSMSLPAGILKNIDMELVHRKVESGSFIILVTDGVIDAFKKEGDGDKLLQEFINRLETTNPQVIADMILEEAYKKCDSKPIDDMLVTVAKVWKRVG
jgi:stage II sporulation protein E